MHEYYWGYRGFPRTQGLSCLSYFNSPVGFWLMISLMVLVVTILVLLTVAVLRKHRHIEGESEAMSVLKRRYASGELTTEDFQRMKKDLR